MCSITHTMGGGGWSPLNPLGYATAAFLVYTLFLNRTTLIVRYVIGVTHRPYTNRCNIQVVYGRVVRPSWRCKIVQDCECVMFARTKQQLCVCAMYAVHGRTAHSTRDTRTNAVSWPGLWCDTKRNRVLMITTICIRDNKTATHRCWKKKLKKTKIIFLFL